MMYASWSAPSASGTSKYTPKRSVPVGRIGSVHSVGSAAPVHTCSPQKSAKSSLVGSP